MFKNCLVTELVYCTYSRLATIGSSDCAEQRTLWHVSKDSGAFRLFSRRASHKIIGSIFWSAIFLIFLSISLHHCPSPEGSTFPSNRRHWSNDDCLEGKRENYQVCSVQYFVQQLCTVQCTHIWTDLTVICWLDLAFMWLYCALQLICVRCSFLGLFCVIVYLCMYAFVVLDLVSSVLRQEIGRDWEERLWNDIFCVEWDVKP